MKIIKMICLIVTISMICVTFGSFVIGSSITAEPTGDRRVYLVDFEISGDVDVSKGKPPGTPGGGGGGGGDDTPPPEVVPWGVDRIDADLIWDITTGSSIKVAVIDTGIDQDHPDLQANIKGGRNFVIMRGRLDTNAWDDDNGHGSHVAGTIAAVDNEEGVIGVANEVWLYGVKVLDKRGSGNVNDVVAGINWAISNDMDVISMSLGTSYDYQTLHDACDNAYAAGIVVVAAAGNNNGGAVDYPAKYESVIAVSATDISDKLAPFSSVGFEVELAAPGVSIYSTYKNSGYNTLSGTSMAAPHVTGTVALVLTTIPGLYDLDGDGWDPAEVRSKLHDTAEDLGVFGKDNSFGFGLVDAEAAVS